jgi:hypothetical protein
VDKKDADGYRRNSSSGAARQPASGIDALRCFILVLGFITPTVKGQTLAKDALGDSGGGHNLPLLGPPGAGNSMLARRLTTILPPMTPAEAIETTRIHSVAGLTGDRGAVMTTRPFPAPITTSPMSR